MEIKEAETKVAKLVVSSGGVWHKILRGPPTFDMADWSTHCTWYFGRATTKNIRLPDGELPEDPKLLCHKCFPGEKVNLKYKELQRLRRHMKEVA